MVCDVYDKFGWTYISIISTDTKDLQTSMTRLFIAMIIKQKTAGALMIIGL